MEKGFGIGVHTDLGIGLARFRASEAFVVHDDVHRLGGANVGIEEEGDGHGIEERGSLLAPFVIEDDQGVGERGALAEEIGALRFIEFELGGIERHDVKRDMGEKEILRCWNVVDDVPFGARGRAWAKAEFAVTAMNGAAHDDDALELQKSLRIFFDESANVDERTDADESDLAGVALDLVENEVHRGRVRRAGERAGIAESALVHAIGCVGGNAGENGDVAAASLGEEAIENPSAGFGIAERRCDAENLEFGTAQGKGHSKSIVNVVADVGINDDFFWRDRS